MSSNELTRRGFLRRGSGAVLAAGALAGGGSTLLSACGGGKKSGKELTFWNFYAPNPTLSPQSAWFTDLVAAWNKNNEVKVKLHFLPVAEYTAGTALQTAFSSGGGPDIFLLSPGDFLRYYNGHVLEDLTPHLSPQVVSDFVPGTLDTPKVGDKIYGLPMEIEPLAMYYRMDAFERAHLSEADVPKTWDQLLDVAGKLTTKNRFGVLFDTTPGYYQNFTWYPFMWMGGGSAVGADGRSSGFDAPGTVNALRFWQQATQRGFAPRRTQGTGGNDGAANLMSGYCAMQQTGSWTVAQLAVKRDFKYGVFPLPVPAGGTYTTIMGGWAFVANSKGRNPDAAAKFIAWALGSADADGVDRMRRWNTVVKTDVPPRRSVQQAADARGAFASGPMKTFLKDVVPGGRGEPRYPPEVYKAISDAIQGCQLNGTDPAKAAGTASHTIDGFLNSYRGARIL